MSGEYNGPQKNLSNLLGRIITYILCQPDRINIFVENARNASFILRDFFNGMEGLYVFFTASTKHHVILESELEETENSSKTRWTARAEAVKAVHISYEKILESLFKIKSSRDIDKTNRMESQAAALYKKMLGSDCICSLFFAKNIVYKLKNLTVQLEKVELNILDALQLIKSTVESFNLIINYS